VLDLDKNPIAAPADAKQTRCHGVCITATHIEHSLTTTAASFDASLLFQRVSALPHAAECTDHAVGARIVPERGDADRINDDSCDCNDDIPQDAAFPVGIVVQSVCKRVERHVERERRCDQREPFEQVPRKNLVRLACINNTNMTCGMQRLANSTTGEARLAHSIPIASKPTACVAYADQCIAATV
jgi:hypothetical protein